MSFQRTGSRDGPRLNHALQLGNLCRGRLAKLLGLGVAQTGDAVAASAVDNVSLGSRAPRPVSTWKGNLAGHHRDARCLCTMLAGREITGPRALFEGPMALSSCSISESICAIRPRTDRRRADPTSSSTAR